MLRLYTIVLTLYFSLLRLAALLHPKAAAWWAARRHWSRPLDALSPAKRTVWIHVASAGEFEQAIPLIRRIRESAPDLQVAVSAYSLSGLSVCRQSGLADACFAFPPDFGYNVKIIINKMNPVLSIFIRNEIWANTLKQLKNQLLPAILINAERIERKGLYGSYLKRAYPYFTRIIYADEFGNTKAERVMEVARTPYTDPVLEAFARDSFVFLLGSCYDTEAKIAAGAYRSLRDHYPRLKVVLCPHTWDETTRQRYESLFGEPIALYSEGPVSTRVLFIDRLGLLKFLYRYADLAFIGGGFGQGVHNVTEAAVYGLPVRIGPEHRRFPEVGTLIEKGQVAVIANTDECRENLLQQLEASDREAQKEARKRDFADMAHQASGPVWNIMEGLIRR